mmetsp:Transcript_26838/g.46603  ORF Transcript_26838/g.46603 Transcript_26838/m.46603 type:complete len:235 (-) Transcript_26838:247-951(-)
MIRRETVRTTIVEMALTKTTKRQLLMLDWAFLPGNQGSCKCFPDVCSCALQPATTEPAWTFLPGNKGSCKFCQEFCSCALRPAATEPARSFPACPCVVDICLACESCISVVVSVSATSAPEFAVDSAMEARAPCSRMRRFFFRCFLPRRGFFFFAFLALAGGSTCSSPASASESHSRLSGSASATQDQLTATKSTSSLSSIPLGTLPTCSTFIHGGGDVSTRPSRLTGKQCSLG